MDKWEYCRQHPEECDEEGEYLYTDKPWEDYPDEYCDSRFEESIDPTEDEKFELPKSKISSNGERKIIQTALLWTRKHSSHSERMRPGNG